MTQDEKFSLIDLPYSQDGLKPVINAETVAFHHGKHLAGYVKNLNGLVKGTEYAQMQLEEIVCKASGAVLNNAGQILNHNLYFLQFSGSPKKSAPTGALLDAVNKAFGSFDAFKAEFEQKGTTLFGSGWVWLAKNPDGSLVITQEVNAANPIQKGLVPLLTFDVWEHAYYLDYQNRRADYLKALWSIVDWSIIEQRYSK